MAIAIFLQYVVISSFACSAIIAITFENQTDEFSLRIYNQAVVGQKDDVVLTPISAQIALLMAAIGANGDTESEILHGLQLVGTKASIVEHFFNLLTPLQSNSSRLQIASRIYMQNSYRIRDSYNALVSHKLYSTAQSIDFSDSSQAAQTINDWLSDKSHGLITNLVSPSSFDANTSMVLANAIYFEDTWKYPFHPYETYPDIFYVNRDVTRIQETMHMTAYLKHAFIDELNSQLLKLPYKNSKYVLKILLPNDRYGLPQLEEKLKTIDVTVLEPLMEYKYVRVSLPKFKTEYQINLNDALKRMGMHTMFSSAANFSGIVENESNPKVSLVVQKAFIEINEAGTHAAATDVPLITARDFTWIFENQVLQFKCDHAFLYFIHDDYGVAYLAGHYTKG